MNRIGVIVESFRLGIPEGLVRAKALGAGAVQVYIGERGATYDRWTPAYRADVKQRAEDLGLAVSAMVGDLGGHGFMLPEENPWRIKETLDRIDLVREMGANVLTCHIGVVPPDPNHPRYGVIADALAQLGAHAQQAGVTIAIETGAETPEVLLGLLETLPGGVGVNYDPANLVMVMGVDPVKGVHTLGKYIVHTHAKDGRMLRNVGPEVVYGVFSEAGIEDERMGDYFIETPLGQGDVDFPAWLKALSDIGYTGYVTIEREAGDQPEKDVGEAVQFLKGLGL